MRRAGLRARLLRVEAGTAASLRPAELGPRPFPDLVAAVLAAPLGPTIRARALAVLARLGEAESRVHDIPPDELRLHELGDDDTLLDVVGVSAALSALEVERVLVSAIPLGASGGTATLELLRGFDLRGAPPIETVTPTAASILAALGSPAPQIPEMTLEAVGYGAGNRDDPRDWPNVVRVLLGTEARTGHWGAPDSGPLLRDLIVLEANLDDLTPELSADAAEALLAGGAMDVWTTPVHMKKGRAGLILSALCQPEAEGRLTRAFFEATTTFGVRRTTVRRAELVREIVGVPLEGGEVRVKVGVLAGRVMSATPEHDDVADLARRIGRPVRVVYEEAAAAARTLRFERVDG